MTLTHTDLSDYVSASRREWLCTNGHGSFASGTVAGVPTRRYHALLVAALTPPTGRMTMLSQVHETVTLEGTAAFDLHTARYADGTIHPQGWRQIVNFSDFPVATWRFALPSGIEIVKRIYLAPERNTVYITYTRLGDSMFGAVTLQCTPLVAWKEYHAEMKPWEGFPLESGFTSGGYQIKATPDAPTLRLILRGAKWTRAGWWHRHIFHEREAERGMDAIEELYCPATAVVTLRPGETVALIGTTEPEEPEDATLVLAEIAGRRQALLDTAEVAEDDAVTRSLVVCADKFIARGTRGRTTVMAGYPWFTDWGRDTMIALPGLCFATHRFEVARDILTAFAGFVSEGMIPNRFPDQGETPDYNTVDGTLWFVHTCGAYAAATGDTDFREQLAPVLAAIIAAHVQGTRYGIGVDAQDGLLSAGEAGTQLTWMDAKVGDYVVTPRQGKPVEINALWIQALQITADFTGDTTYRDRAERAIRSFRAAFTRPDGQGLYDVICPDGTPDAAIRPNQIIAAALPGVLSDDTARAVVDVVVRELVTPYGLRTLSPADPAYRPRYEGNAWSRDTAYHQGTVWPWLLGPYADAHYRVHGTWPDLSALLDQLTAYGIGGLAEVYDGSEPQRPNGCPWQAWSVAEVLRIHRHSKMPRSHIDG